MSKLKNCIRTSCIVLTVISCLVFAQADTKKLSCDRWMFAIYHTMKEAIDDFGHRAAELSKDLEAQKEKSLFLKIHNKFKAFENNKPLYLELEKAQYLALCNEGLNINGKTITKTTELSDIMNFHEDVAKDLIPLLHNTHPSVSRFIKHYKSVIMATKETASKASVPSVAIRAEKLLASLE